VRDLSRVLADKPVTILGRADDEDGCTLWERLDYDGVARIQLAGRLGVTGRSRQ